MRNVSILTIVVIGLVVALILALVLIGAFVLNDKSIPGELWTFVTAVVTGLLGLLAPSKDATAPAA